MELKRIYFKVEAEVTFSTEEVEYLIERAKSHYDATCQNAGLSMDEGARENGFISRLKMFPGPSMWTSRNLDIAMKVLEMTDGNPMGQRIFGEIWKIFQQLEHAHTEANGRTL